MPKENDIEFIKSKDKDLYYAIHNCKLVNPKITQDGYFEGTIIDYYDFEYIEGTGFGVELNNWGYSMQQKGSLKNYYLIFSIKKYSFNLLYFI